MACLPLLFWLGVITSMLIGVGNAGNDLSNAMGVTVGARVLPLKHAVAVGALFDGMGGLLMGGRVTNTISAGVLDPEIYKEDPSLLAKAMLVVMFSGGCTMLTATFCKVPISAHHSVVGSLVAVGLLTKGASSVHWNLVRAIVFSWIGNPLLGLCTSLGLFVWLDAFVLARPEPAAAFGQYKWALYLFSFLACLPFVLAKSPQIALGPDISIAVSAALGLVFASYSELLQAWLRSVQRRFGAPPLSSGRGSSRGSAFEDGDAAYDEVGVGSSSEEEAAGELTRDGMLRAEKLRAVEVCFGPLLILSALSVAFVHGAQDVSNAAGPLTQIVLQAHGSVVGAGGLPWPLLLGVAAFVLGDLTLGYKVIGTVGSNITDMTPSRAFAAQMGTVVALTSATMLALPVSTSECIVGSVIGVGLGKKLRSHTDAALNAALLKKIWAAWLLTIPYAAMIAAVFFQVVEVLCQLVEWRERWNL